MTAKQDGYHVLVMFAESYKVLKGHAEYYALFEVESGLYPNQNLPPTRQEHQDNKKLSVETKRSKELQKPVFESAS